MGRPVSQRSSVDVARPDDQIRAASGERIRKRGRIVRSRRPSGRCAWRRCAAPLPCLRCRNVPALEDRAGGSPYAAVAGCGQDLRDVAGAVGRVVVHDQRAQSVDRHQASMSGFRLSRSL